MQSPSAVVKQNHPQALTARPQQKPVAVTPISTRAPIFYKQNTPTSMTGAKSLPLGVPAFKPLKTPATLAIFEGATSPNPATTNSLQTMKQKLHQPAPLTSPAINAQNSQLLLQLQKQQQAHTPSLPAQSTFSRKVAMLQYPGPNLMLANSSFIQSQLAMQGLYKRSPETAFASPNYAPRYAPVSISPAAGPFKVAAVPAFQAMPSSVSRISTGQIVHLDVNGKTEAVNPNSIYATSVKRDVSYSFCQN